MPHKNKEDRLACNRKSYAKNAESVKAKVAIKKQQYKREWAEFKSRLSCIACGENHPATLDFHHVIIEPGNRKIHAMVSNGAYAAAIEEIKKCVVFCANCHRKHHYDERKKAPEGAS